MTRPRSLGRRLALLLLGLTALVTAATVSNASSALATTTNCGSLDRLLVWNIKATNVGCKAARAVGRAYARNMRAGGTCDNASSCTVRRYRCRNKSYGEGNNVSCRRGGRKIRFAHGT